jgi:hypothetical protein
MRATGAHRLMGGTAQCEAMTQFLTRQYRHTKLKEKLPKPRASVETGLVKDR